MIGSTAQIPSMTSPQQLISDTRASYRTDGVAICRDLLGSQIRARIADGLKDLRHGISTGSIDRQARFVNGELPQRLGKLYLEPPLVSFARDLLETDDIALYMNRVLLKDRAWSGDVAIHQDMPYFSGGTRKLSAFIPLQPTAGSAGGGGLIFVKGSHRFGNLQRGTIKREIFPAMEDFAPSLDVGDVIWMNFLTWHYSEAAVVPDERPILQVVYQPSDDGSYGTAKLGVPQPTLVCGRWNTEYFAPWGDSIAAYAPTPADVGRKRWLPWRRDRR
jgi:phytanoyl-CoA dioxygenase PhyH